MLLNWALACMTAAQGLGPLSFPVGLILAFTPFWILLFGITLILNRRG